MTTCVALEYLPETIWTVMSSAIVMVTEAELGMTQPGWLRVHLLVVPALPLPAGVLLRHVDPGLQHGLHPGPMVSTVGTPEVAGAGTDGHALDTVSVVSPATAVSVDNVQIHLPPSPQLLLTNGAGTGAGLSPWLASPQVPMATAHTFELTKILHQTIMLTATLQMVSLLAGWLSTANCSAFLLTKHTFQPGPSPDLLPDVSW